MARARGSLVFQLKERMNGMTAFGCSKYADKQLNHGKPAKDRIYSYKTFHNYLTVGCAFLNYVRAEHPGIKNLDDTRQYVEEYLTKRIEHGLSAWTVRLDAAALAKVFQCSCYDFGVSLPSRNRSEITKNKTHSCEGHFSLDKNKKQVDFCLGTGLRRSELMKVTPEQVVQKEAGVWLMGIKGKGGRVRDVPVDPQYAARVREIAQEARDAGRCRIFERVNKNLPAHEYRAQYAQNFYNRIACPAEELDRDRRFIMRNGHERSEVYEARRDRAGTHYDARAMEEVSYALGHSRLDVVTAYIR